MDQYHMFSFAAHDRSLNEISETNLFLLISVIVPFSPVLSHPSPIIHLLSNVNLIQA